MTTNSQIILDSILDARKSEVDPNEKASSFFEFFVALQIVKDFDLSYDEIETGLVGGGRDGGVDGMYLLVNGDLAQEDSDYSQLKKDIVIDLIIFQSKTTPGFQETPVERFITFSNDLFDLSGDLPNGSYNERIVEAIQLFHKVYREFIPSFPSLKVTFSYASKGADPSDNVKHKVEMLREIVVSSMPDAEFDFRFLGAEQLLELARRQPQRTYSLPLAESPISSEDQVGFVCLVRLRDFFKFLTDETESALQRQLFEANVRDYQGRTEVNDEIQASLQNQAAEDFWWLNNGVSILATQASLAGKTLTIQDPQIVNGLQTSTEVYKYCKDSLETNDYRKILVRVMVPKEEDSRDRIIKATNSQTSVQLSSLRATHKIHREIEEYLLQKGLFYDRRKNFYKNEGKPRSKIVGIPYLAQAVMAIVLRKPDQARARPSSLLKADEEYQQVFNSSYPINLYYVCAEAMLKVESYLKSSSANVATKDRNNLRFYVAMHAVSGVGKPPTPRQLSEFDVSTLDETAIEKSLDFIRPHYVELGGDDQTSKGPHLLQAILPDKTAS